jgi:hypothetical protein
MRSGRERSAYPGRVEDEGHAVALRQLSHGGEVVDREGLPARHVQARLLADVGDLAGRGRLQDLLEPPEVDVALEREDRLGHLGLVDGHVHPQPAGELDVLPRGREVEVRGHFGAGPDEREREQVLRAPTLVRGDQVPVAERLAHGLLEAEEAARARVGLVPELHRGALLLRERGGAAVGEQVDEHVLRAQEKRVVAGLAHRHAPVRG